MRRRFGITFAVGVGLALGGCSGCRESAGGGSGGGGGEATAPRADRPDAFDGLDTHLDLLDAAHLADVDHHGLFVDFGTPARMKYTLGQWRTGWGSDQSVGTTTFTNAGAAARIYFHTDRQGPLTLRLRARPIGTRNMTVYFNNQALPLVRLDEGNEWKDYDVAVPPEHVVAGENYVLLRFGGTQRVGTEDVAVQLDSFRVLGGAPDSATAFSAPAYGDLVTEVRVDDEPRRALAVRAPTTLSFYLSIPERAKLGFAVGAEGERPAPATAKVVVTPEGGQPAEVFSEAVEGEWHDEVVDLARFANQVVRVDFRVEGQGGSGRVAWGTPEVLVSPPEERPELKRAKNVVVVLIDTMRADYLKPYNANAVARTPVLDRVSGEGAVFTSAQSPENWTKPSVASVLTGLFPMTHGAKTDEARLPEAAITLSEALKEAGFATGSFIANGYVSDRFGFAQGWDHYTNYIRENRPTTAENVFREAAEWVEAHKGERFFAYVHTIDPHVPYDPPQRFLEMYDAQPYTGQVSPRRTGEQLEGAKRNPPTVVFDARDNQRLVALYNAEVSYHDHYLGEFIDRLRRAGVLDDTLIVITSDHGEEFNDHGSYGHGHSVYQELLHVPLSFRLPGAAPARAFADTVSTADIMPTVLELTGVARHAAIEGRSLAPYFRGDTPTRAPAVAFSDFLDDRRVIRAGRWKLILRGLNPTFFDLQSDPGEQRELPLTQHPIAMRFCRVHLGQFLGASNRAAWFAADGGPAQTLRHEDVVVDPQMREQLRALGYAGGAGAPTRAGQTATDTH